MNKRYKFYIILNIFLFSSCREYSQSHERFGTNIYPGYYKDLAEGLKNENVQQIEDIAILRHLNLNYADPVNGISLLNWCIIKGKLSSFEKLLRLGADPNWKDTLDTEPPPIIRAAQVPFPLKFLQIALHYNGDPNLVVPMVSRHNNTPLFGAVFSASLENVKILIEHGAKPDLRLMKCWTPLAEALSQGEIEISKYLIEHGADVRHLNIKDINGLEVNILDLLRDSQFQYPLNSDKYLIKMEIVRILSTQGLDYWSYPIPDDVKEAHKDDPEYLKKY